MRVIKDVRKSVAQILNPNRVAPEEMTLTKPADVATFTRQTYPNLGKWIYVQSTAATLNYVEYDTTQADKKKTIQKTSFTGTN